MVRLVGIPRIDENVIAEDGCKKVLQTMNETGLFSEPQSMSAFNIIVPHF